MKAKPNLFRYNDYRQFLADWIGWKVAAGRYSLRQFAKTAGYSSPNILQTVMSGQKNLGSKGLQKFSIALGLSDDERLFFEALVAMTQAATPGERIRIRQRLLRFPQRRKIVPLEKTQLQVFRHWLSPVIYEMIDFPDFRPDAEWIAGLFAQEVSIHEVRRALADLVATDMVTIGDSGALIKSEPEIDSGVNVVDESLFSYHETALMKTADALLTVPVEKRTFNVLTVAAPRHVLEKLERKFASLEAELLSMLASETEPKEEVFQISWYAFPILQRRTKGKNQ